MATPVEQLPYLPSPVFPDDYMSSAEFSNYLTFLPNSSALDFDTVIDLRGTTWIYTHRTPVRLAVARALHWGSTPDWDIDFMNPHQPKAKCTVIGSGRPKPKSSKPDSFGEAFGDPEITSIKLANAKLTRPKESKFAKLFDPSGPHGETATAYFLGESTPSADHRETSTSTRVSFDVGALYAIPSTAEKKAKCSARSRELVNEEAAALKHTPRWDTEQDAECETRAHVIGHEEAAALKDAFEDAFRSTMEAVAEMDEETSTPAHMHEVIDHINRTFSIAEKIMEVDYVETEEEEQRGRTLTRSDRRRTRERISVRSRVAEAAAK